MLLGVLAAVLLACIMTFAFSVTVFTFVLLGAGAKPTPTPALRNPPGYSNPPAFAPRPIPIPTVDWAQQRREQEAERRLEAIEEELKRHCRETGGRWRSGPIDYGCSK